MEAWAETLAVAVKLRPIAEGAPRCRFSFNQRLSTCVRCFIHAATASFQSAGLGSAFAARFNPIIKAFYDRLLQADKPEKLALPAVMRKRIVRLKPLPERSSI